MPPKRKAAAAPPEDSPPLKRRLRSAKHLPPDPQPPRDPSVTQKKRRVASKAAKAIETETKTPTQEDPPRPRKRGRAPKTAARAKSTRKIAVDEAPPKPSTSKEKLDDTDKDGKDKDSEPSDDELLLAPRERTSSPPPTTPPPRNVTPVQTNATPRYVLDSVEVRTPSWLNKSVASRYHDTTSPGPKKHATTHTSPQSRNSDLRSKSPYDLTNFAEMPVGPPISSRRSPRKTVRHNSNIQSNVTDVDNVYADTPVIPIVSPSKGINKALASPHKAGPSVDALPETLHACLHKQKAAILKALHKSPPIVDFEDEEDVPANVIAEEQLNELLRGTVLRGEGNSCILTGPPGSGKTQMVERVLSKLPERPIVIRLSGHAQTDDRLAMREIAWQLAQQTGTSFMPQEDGKQDQNKDGNVDDEDNPFLDSNTKLEPGISMPPSAHLLALIAVIPTLSRPTVIVLDAFDLFAMHARQSLLYCLFDTAQHSRVGANDKGIAIVGVTTRIDTINLLEKRVKSRFSGRILRTAGPGKLNHWLSVAKSSLCVPIESENAEEWTPLWRSGIDRFLEDDEVKKALAETTALTRDQRMLSRILTATIIDLEPSAPFPTASHFMNATKAQRCPDSSYFLPSLAYPAICLLIAAVHASISGHDTFTFEMLHEAFRDQVRTSQSAPVQIRGGGIGMVRCSREVLIGTFERLIDLRIFVIVAAPSAGSSKEFARCRSSVEYAEVKSAVEKTGQMNLKKWFSKGKAS